MENKNSTSNYTNDADMAFNLQSLTRAVECLNQCIILCSGDSDNDSDNKEGHMNKNTNTNANTNTNYHTNNDRKKGYYLESARVLLAYVLLELNKPSEVIKIAELMLKKEKPLYSSNSAGTGAITRRNDRNGRRDYCINSLRRRATMRMYACEALYMLGNPSEGLHYLNDDFTLNHDGDTTSGSSSNSIENTCLLAAHLATVNVPQNTKKQLKLNQDEIKRLKHAKASIQISASMSNLSLGNIGKAEEEAHSACNILHNETGMNANMNANANVNTRNLKDAAYSSLIQSLICGGKIADAVQVARNLK
jgi:hypothetical protein